MLIGMAYSQNNVINIYNWSAYTPKSVIKLFTKQTGIHVNYTTYASNEELYEKLKADPSIGYDIIVPSSYFVQRMAKEGMLEKLDLKQLPNLKNINPLLLNKPYDPGNQYSIPYLWGTTSIIVNNKYYDPKTITTWNDLWQQRFYNQLLLNDDMRDVFSIGLAALGYSINTSDPEQIKQAYLKLRQLMPNVKLFSSDGAIPIMLDEDATIGVVYSGDAEQMTKGNKKLRYVYTKSGIIIWIDCMSIPKNAPHLANAYKFINFIMQPKIAKMISMQLGYSSPNITAVHGMPNRIQNNMIMYPPQNILAHGQTEGYLGKATQALYLHYWELLKISG